MKRLYTYRNKDRKCRRRGFTLVEVIAVLVIIAIVAAFATPGIVTYMKNMRQVRQDDTVRLLYSAAQNRLTYLSGHDPDGAYNEFRKLFVPEGDVEAQQGFVGGHYKGSGIGDTDSIAINVLCGSDNKPIPLTEDGKIVYSTSGSGDGSAAVGTAISSGSANMRAEPIGVYHIPADKDDLAAERAKEVLLGESGMLNAIEPGEVEIDVDLTLRFILQVRYKNSYMAAPSIYNESNVVVPDSADVKTETLQMNVYADNGEELLIHVTCDTLSAYDTSVSPNRFLLSMTMTGESSGASKEYTLIVPTDTGDPNYKAWFAETPTADKVAQYDIVLTLDSLKENLHFADIFGADDFIPGEDISVTFQLFYNGGLTTTVEGKSIPVVVNPSAYSTVSVNSLFADVKENDGAQTAYLANGRHLQNLTNCADVTKDPVTAALQYGDIDWANTQKAYGDTALDTFALVPIVNDNIVKFDGANGTAHTISNLRIDGSKATTNTGMFDTTDAAFSNVQLVKPTVVSGKGNVGTLAGKLTGGKIEDCVITNPSVTKSDATTEGVGGLVGAVMPADGETAKITGCGVYITDTTNLTNYNVTATNGTAGGLVGVVSGEGSTEITTSFAAVNSVSGGASVGGLIGSIAGKTKVESCYADTKTISGTTSVGGFAGSVGADASVSYSYAVTEVLRANPTGGTAAGFAASNAGSIDHSYALVGSVLTGDETNGCTGATRYGFAPGTASKCYYYATKEFGAEKDAGAGTQKTSIVDLTYQVYQDATGESMTGKWEYDVDWDGETTTNNNSYPYTAYDSSDDEAPYNYMYSVNAASTTVANLAFPAPRIAGIDHYGDWPEPAVKYAIEFVFAPDTSLAKAIEKLEKEKPEFVTKRISDYNIDAGDYEPGTKIVCPPILENDTDIFKYVDVNGEEHQYITWTTYQGTDKPELVHEGLYELSLTEDELAALADKDNIVRIYAVWTGMQNVVYDKNEAGLGLPTGASVVKVCKMPDTQAYFSNVDMVSISDEVIPNNASYCCEVSMNGVKSWYLFVSWNTKPDGSGETYEAGQTDAFLMPVSEVTLYAQWEKAPTVAYDANLPTDKTLDTAGMTKTLPGKTGYAKGAKVNIASSPELADESYCYVDITNADAPVTYVLSGWHRTEAEADNRKYEFRPGKEEAFTLTGSEDVTLYAVWERMYSVSYDANIPDGASLVSTKTLPEKALYAAGKTVTITKRLLEKDEGYRCTDASGVTYLLVGWNRMETAADAGTVQYAAYDGATAATFEMPGTDVVLYAVWKPAYKVTYEKNAKDPETGDPISISGNAPKDDNLYYSGETVSVPDGGAMTYSGTDRSKRYEFLGWAESDTAAEPDYVKGVSGKDSFAMPSKNTTLYAVWKLISTRAEVTVLLDDVAWTDRTVKLVGEKTYSLTYDESLGAYKNTDELLEGSYRVIVDGETEASLTVVENDTVKAEVDFYTITTRCGDINIDNTTQKLLSGSRKSETIDTDKKIVTGIYRKGSRVKLDATPATSKQFTLWSYTPASADDEMVTASMNKTIEVTADTGSALEDKTINWPLDLTAQSIYRISYILVGVEDPNAGTTSKNVTQWEAGSTGKLTAKFIESKHYLMPPKGSAAVIVTRNGIALRKDTDYTWDSENGTIVIDGSQITSNISVYISGIPEEYYIYYDTKVTSYPIETDYKTYQGSYGEDAPGFTKAEAYQDYTLKGDSIKHGTAEGNLKRAYDINGYVTIRPEEYYSLPQKSGVKIWSFNEETDKAGNVNASRTLLEEGKDYTYSFTDEEKEEIFNTGVIVLNEKRIPGKYVVIEAECVPTEYTLHLNLKGADAMTGTGADAEKLSLNTDGFVLDTAGKKQTTTHFDKDDITFTLKPWKEQGDYTLPENILVRMGSAVVSGKVIESDTTAIEATDRDDYKYIYNKTTGEVVIFGHLTGDNHTATGVTGDIEITAISREQTDTVTVYAYKDADLWPGLTVELKNSTNTYSEPKTVNGAYIFEGAAAGTYHILVNGNDIGQQVTKVRGSDCAAYVYFYTLSVTAGKGIDGVSIEDGTATVYEESADKKSRVYHSGAEVTITGTLDDNGHNHFGGWENNGKTYIDAAKCTAADQKTFTYHFASLRSRLELTAFASYDTLKISYRDYDEANAASAPYSGDTLPADRPMTHAYGTGTTLPKPTKKGYDFDAWYVNVNGTYVRYLGLDDDVFAGRSDGDTVEVCARWEPKSYTVTLDLSEQPDNKVPNLNKDGWPTGTANPVYSYKAYSAHKLPGVNELTINSVKRLIGFVVTRGGNDVWPDNVVLKPESDFGAYGDVTLKPVWDKVNDLELEVLVNGKDWTDPHPDMKIELRRGGEGTGEPLNTYLLTNGKYVDNGTNQYTLYYLSVHDDIALGSGAYQVYVDGKAYNKFITIEEKAEGENPPPVKAQLNLYTVTYHAGTDSAASYSGSVPVDDTYYLSGDTYTVMPNTDALAMVDSDGNTVGTLIGWADSEKLDDAKLFAFGSEQQIKYNAVELYGLWLTGRIGIIEVDGTTVKKASGWNMATDTALTAEELPTTAKVTKGSGYYIFVSNDFAVKGLKNGVYTNWKGFNASTAGSDANYSYYKLEEGVSSVSGSFEDLITLNGAWNDDSLVFGKDYLLTYVKNGADSGKVPDIEKFSVDGGAQTVTIQDPRLIGNLKRDRYDFIGWNTKADGSGTSYQPGDTATMDKNLTLYAQWGYTLHFELGENGSGTGFGDVKLGMNESHQLPENKPANSGKQFAGWALADDRTTVVYQAGDTVSGLTPDENKVATLVAVWASGGTITVKYDANGEDSGWVTDDHTQSAFKNIPFTLLTEVPTHDDKLPFICWKDDSGNEYQPGQTVTFTADTTLTAYWGDNVRWTNYPAGHPELEWSSTLSKAMENVRDFGTDWSEEDEEKDPTKVANNLVFYGDTSENTSGITVEKRVCITSVGDFTANWDAGSKQGNSTNSFLKVNNHKTLTLGQDSYGKPMSGTLTFDAERRGRLVELPGTNSILKTYDGVTLTNGELNSGTGTANNGAGVDVRPGAYFYMFGGTISKCITKGGDSEGAGGGGGGGGVYLAQGGYLQMGTMTVLKNGIPIKEVEGKTERPITGGTEQPYSSTKTYYVLDKTDKYWKKPNDTVTADMYYSGETEYAVVSGTPAILNCEARGKENTVSNTSGGGGDGGGICCGNMVDQMFLLYSGKVSGNIASVKGGGIRTDSDNSNRGGAEIHLRIYEIEISNNTAAFGGGLFQWQGSLSIMNSQIFGNKANAAAVQNKTTDKRNNTGGAMMIDNWNSYQQSVVEIYNGSIYGNEAERGGAIYMGGGGGNNGDGDNGTLSSGYTQLIIYGGSIYNNTASSLGDGIYVSGRCNTCTIEGGNIFENGVGRADGSDIYMSMNNGNNTPHAVYLLTSADDLSTKLNTSEAAKGQQVRFCYSTDPAENRKLLRYAKATYSTDNSNDSLGTAVKSVAGVTLEQRWEDAQCFSVNGWDGGIKPNPDTGTSTENAEYYLVLGTGYQVTYEANDDSEQFEKKLPEPHWYSVGAPVKVTDIIPTKEGWATDWFRGWKNKDGTTAVEGAPIESGGTFAMPAGNVTLVPAWRTDGVRLVYHANPPKSGLTLKVPTDRSLHEYSSEYSAGNKITLQFDMPEIVEGYRFLGWSTDLKATAAEYNEKDLANESNKLELTPAIMAKVVDNTLTVYAVWQKVGNVVYDPNFYGRESKDSHMPTDDAYYRADDPNSNAVKVLFRDSSGNKPGRSGYIFLGWSMDPNATEPTYTETGLKSFLMSNNNTTTLYAVWKKGYKVYYMANDGTKDEFDMPMEAAYDQTAYDEGAIVNVVTKFSDIYQQPQNRKFLGWSPEQNAAKPLFPVGASNPRFQIGASDYYLYAVWQKQVKVDYYDYVTTDTASRVLTLVKTDYVAPDDVVDLSLRPAVTDGLSFEGWVRMDARDTLLSGMLAQRDVELIARYANTVEVTLDYGYEDKIETVLVSKNETLADALTAKQKTPSRNTYQFKNWYTTAGFAETVNLNAELKENLTIYADWVRNPSFTLIYYSNIPGASAEGKVGEQMIDGTDFGAVWSVSLNPYTVTRTGYEFNGWNTKPDGSGTDYKNGEEIKTYERLDPLAESLSLYAKWKRKTFTLRIDLNGGTADADFDISPKSIWFEEPIPDAWIPESLTREHYRFIGWDQTIPATMPAHDVTLKAMWKGNDVTVHFDKNYVDETVQNPEPLVYEYGAPYDGLPSVSRTGYSFRGWLVKDDITTLDKTHMVGDKGEVDEAYNATLYADWNPNRYVMVFENTFAEVMPEQEFFYDDAEQALTVFTREGYTFRHWAADEASAATKLYDGGQSLRNVTDVDGRRISLWAVWDANPYTVRFDANGGTFASGTAPDPVTVTYDGTYAALSSVEKPKNDDGTIFAGWYTAAEGGTEVKAEDIVKTAADQTLYAHWRNGYTLTLWNGTDKVLSNDGVKTVTKQDGITVPAAVKPKDKGNWKFDGWYTKTSDGKPGVQKLNKDGKPASDWKLEDDTNLYAVWKNDSAWVKYSGTSLPTTSFMIVGADGTTALGGKATTTTDRRGRESTTYSMQTEVCTPKSVYDQNGTSMTALDLPSGTVENEYKWSGTNLKNGAGDYYLYRNSSSLSIGTTKSNWSFDGTQLTTKKNSNNYYLYLNGSSFALSSTANNVDLYVQKTAYSFDDPN